MHATTRVMKLLPPAYSRSAPFHALSRVRLHTESIDSRPMELVGLRLRLPYNLRC
jgi:hypothetical protein